MNRTASQLEIHVYGVDGHVGAFVQKDARIARDLLAQIDSGKIFGQRYLAIAGEHSITVFPAQAIVRLDLVMDGFPDWPFRFGVSDAQQITEAEFRQRRQADQQPVHRPGVVVAQFARFGMASGEDVFMEVRAHVEPRLPVELDMLVQQILSAPSLHCRRLGGGAVVLNPAHIARATFYPAPPERLPNAWPAEPLSGDRYEV